MQVLFEIMIVLDSDTHVRNDACFQSRQKSTYFLVKTRKY